MNDLTHIMLDIETISNDTRRGIILAIGAIAFTQHGDVPVPNESDYKLATELGKPILYMPVDIVSQKDLGLEMDGETVVWWLKSDRIDKFLTMLASLDRVPVHYAFSTLLQWITTQEPDKSKRRLWSHGVTYDCVHIAEKWSLVMGDKITMNELCPFRQMRDTRTLFELYERRFNASPYPAVFHEQKHHALYDAYVQAKAVQVALQKLTM